MIEVVACLEVSLQLVGGLILCCHQGIDWCNSLTCIQNLQLFGYFWSVDKC